MTRDEMRNELFELSNLYRACEDDTVTIETRFTISNDRWDFANFLEEITELLKFGSGP